MADKIKDEIISQLASSIADDVGNGHEDELDVISNEFNKSLANALKAFNSTAFDNDGFIKRMHDFTTGTKDDKDVIKNVLSGVKSEYINVESLNQKELLLRRDITNICAQMPEMHDVIQVIRDAIIECNVASGEVSRSLMFGNIEDNESYETQVKEIENRHDLLLAIKNHIVSKTLMSGEGYILRKPYAKLFAELEALNANTFVTNGNKTFKESIPNAVMNGFEEPFSLYTEENVSVLLESVSHVSNIDSSNDYNIDGGNNKPPIDKIAKQNISNILENINICNGSSPLIAEAGIAGAKEFILKEYNNHIISSKQRGSHFYEASLSFTKSGNGGMFANVDEDMIDFKQYNDIKGVYIKYLDPLKTVPIRIDKRIVGYYYITTTMDLQNNPAQPNGTVDLSYQNYTRDKKMVDRLANIIIKSFNKPMLEKNIKLKSEIADIVMAHKFSEGRLSFIYIPEDEVERFVINEDENGRGHSVLEPTIFSARNYLMLNMYNIIYTLNNNTTRVHYIKSSGLNKDYASQVQRTMRKFQSRRITIDDIYSYSGVLNKIGGMGEMVLPAGRNDYKALETDTIEAVQNPIDINFLEQQRRQAISGTGAPHLLVINAIDEVDFAKTLEMANARFLSTVSSYKIDFNRPLSKLYQYLMRWESDIPLEDIQSFKFKFNEAKHQELNITSEMIQNYNSVVELVGSIYYKKSDLEDENGNPTAKQMILRKELAKKYLPQLDFDELDDVVKKVDIDSTDDLLQDIVNKSSIDENDLDDVNTQ